MQSTFWSKLKHIAVNGVFLAILFGYLGIVGSVFWTFTSAAPTRLDARSVELSAATRGDEVLSRFIDRQCDNARPDRC